MSRLGIASNLMGIIAGATTIAVGIMSYWALSGENTQNIDPTAAESAITSQEGPSKPPGGLTKTSPTLQPKSSKIDALNQELIAFDSACLGFNPMVIGVIETHSAARASDAKPAGFYVEASLKLTDTPGAEQPKIAGNGLGPNRSEQAFQELRDAAFAAVLLHEASCRKGD